jgi:four helix bundle protein
VSVAHTTRMVKSYRDLEIWQRAMALVTQCYRVAEGLPRSEVFGLALQVRRSAVSVPSNIAEGHGRSATGDYLRHLAIAHGSLMELETQIEIAGRLGFVKDEQVAAVLRETGDLGRMIHGLVRNLKARREDALLIPD